MSTKNSGLYPDYDVMAHADQWDDLTRKIVIQRLNPPVAFTALNNWEQKMIAKVSEHLAYDDRNEIIAWIVSYFDSQLAEEIGESERKPNTPPQRQLICDGLKAIDHWARMIGGQGFWKAIPRSSFKFLQHSSWGNLVPLINGNPLCKRICLPNWQVWLSRRTTHIQQYGLRSVMADLPIPAVMSEWNWG